MKRWVGRHMNATRWAILWTAIFAGCCYGIVFVGISWYLSGLIPAAAISLFMGAGNVGRIGER